MGGGAAGLGALAMLPSASAFSINPNNPLSFNNPGQSGTEFEVSPSGDITSLNSFNTGNPVQFQDQIKPKRDIKDDQDVTVYDRPNKTIGDGTTQANHQSISTAKAGIGGGPVLTSSYDLQNSPRYIWAMGGNTNIAGATTTEVSVFDILSGCFLSVDTRMPTAKTGGCLAHHDGKLIHIGGNAPTSD